MPVSRPGSPWRAPSAVAREQRKLGEHARLFLAAYTAGQLAAKGAVFTLQAQWSNVRKDLVT